MLCFVLGVVLVVLMIHIYLFDCQCKDVMSCSEAWDHYQAPGLDLNYRV